MEVFLNLLMVASMPVLKLLLISALGLVLALKRVDILGEAACDHLNQVVFYVLCPAIVGANLAETITFKNFLTMWFMPVNVLLTFLIGSLFGWVLCKLTGAQKHMKSLIISSCSAGNLGIMPFVVVPAMCKEKGSPFGQSDICQSYGLAYASFSMALGSIYFWLYVYNLVRISSKKVEEEDAGTGTNGVQPGGEMTLVIVRPADQSAPSAGNTVGASNGLSYKINWCLSVTLEKINLKALLAPTTIGAVVGFFIGTIPLLRKLLIGNTAPLHVVTDTALMIGDAAIPVMTFIIGANLLGGLKGSGINLHTNVGIIVVRYIFLPLIGILIVKGAVHAGLVQSHDRLFQFTLLLQHAVPPAVNIGTVTQMFGAGQNECSVIMLWTNALAPVVLTLWYTAFLWLVAP